MDFNWLNISLMNWTLRVSFSKLELVINFGSKTLLQDQSKCKNMIDDWKLNVKTNSSMKLFHLKHWNFNAIQSQLKLIERLQLVFFVLLLVFMQYAFNLAIIKVWSWRVLVSTKFWLIFLTENFVSFYQNNNFMLHSKRALEMWFFILFSDTSYFLSVQINYYKTPVFPVFVNNHIKPLTKWRIMWCTPVYIKKLTK